MKGQLNPLDVPHVAAINGGVAVVKAAQLTEGMAGVPVEQLKNVRNALSLDNTGGTFNAEVLHLDTQIELNSNADAGRPKGTEIR